MAQSRLIWRFPAVLILTLSSQASGQENREVVFVPVPPCRVVDSRISQGTTGPLNSGVTHPVHFRNLCGIPGITIDGGSEVNQATALALNIVAVSPAGFGHLVAWPTNRPMPVASVINYSLGQNIANGVVVPMCDQEASAALVCQSGDISFLAAVSSIHLVVDVTGYYIKPVDRGTGRHGAGAGLDSFLCPHNAQGVRFGLSSHMAQRLDADRLCPAGTWVCTSTQVNTGVGCDTTRGDTTCDGRNCFGSCLDNPTAAHRGWTNTPHDDFGANLTMDEAGVFVALAQCEMHPAWCCSRL